MGSMKRILNLSRSKKILLLLAVGSLAGAAFVYNWLFVDLPSIDALEAGLALPSTRIYDRNGQLLYEILPPDGGRNTAIALEAVPAALRQRRHRHRGLKFLQSPRRRH